MVFSRRYVHLCCILSWHVYRALTQASHSVCSSSTRGDPNIHLVSTGVSSNPAANPGAQRVSDTQKLSAPNSTSSPTPNRVAAHGSSSPAASRKSTHQEASWEGNSSNASHSSGQLDSKSDNEVQKLQERCAKLEARLSRQNAAVLECKFVSLTLSLSLSLPLPLPLPLSVRVCVYIHSHTNTYYYVYIMHTYLFTYMYTH